MRRNIFVSLGFAAIAIVLVVASCKKINLATDLGQGLIPEVDNIHTFDTTIEVETYNHIFTAANDSFRIHSNLEQFLGLIDDDPIFGKTDARMYFQVGPASRTKYYFPNTPDKLFLDSVVLIVRYVETYGDSTIPQTIRVSEISQLAHFRSDSFYTIRNNNFPTSTVLGTATVAPHTLKDSVYFGADTVKSVRNLRIKLDNSFGRRLMAYDSTNAYAKDSAFKEYFKGFALESVGNGNALMGFNLSGSGLAFYYHHEIKDSAGKFDTTATFFPFLAGPDAVANYVSRDYTGKQISSVSDDNVADQLIYIQNTPGTYATLKLPALASMSNRIVHLAELQMESVHDPSDALFKAPNLYMDAWAGDKNFNIPFALSDYFDGYTGQLANTGLIFFGSFPRNKTDVVGNSIKYWRFNLTRYVQNVVNKKKPLYDLRLYAKPDLLINDTIPGIGPRMLYADLRQSTAAPNLTAPAIGRVRLGGGMHPTQKMKMRIVYSKL